MKKIRFKAYILHILVVIILLIYNYHMINQLYVMIYKETASYFQIDYEKFREIYINSEYISKLQNEIQKENKNENMDYEAMDYFTIQMILNKFNSLEFRKIPKVYLDQILEDYSYNKEYKILKEYYRSIFSDIEIFPVHKNTSKSVYYSYVEGWLTNRSYGGNRKHEGTDIISIHNNAGVYPIRSITDGVIEQIGWLEVGGYRIGVRSRSGGYFYYAHLDSWVEGLDIGTSIKAGQVIGYMGDTGYGTEGTRGEFVVHLHQGIYVETREGELAVNPYHILRYLESIK